MQYKMKDSGVEWIGEVPNEWEILIAKNAFEEVKEKNTTGEYSRQLSFRYGKIVDKTVNTATVMAEDETTSLYRVVKPNTIIINGLNLNYDFVTQRVAIVTNTGIITSAYLAIRCNQRMLYPEYALYLFKSYDSKQVFHSYGSGIRKTLKFNDFKDIPVVTPPKEEQIKIIDYLDEKCGVIDEIIEQAKATIEEYKAWKSSVIFEAVTKGLDPNAEMKDCNIPEIGLIPCKSQVIKIRYLISCIESGVSVNAGQEPAQEGEMGILKTSAVSQYKFIQTENKNVNLEEYSRLSCPVKSNTIIVSRMNTPELVGACGYVDKSYGNLFLPDRLWQVHFTESTNVKYIWYYLCSNYVRNYYASLSTGTSSSMQNISQEQFFNVNIILPTEDEQSRIVNFLDRKCSVIDEIIAEKEALIADMDAYKKSLIFETVTGKRKVC